MFDKTIIIPKSYKNLKLNFGEVAESLLFFENVNLYLKDQNLEELIRQIPLDYILVLIKEFGLNLKYTKNHLQIYQRPKGKYTQIGIGYLTSKTEKTQLIETLLKHYYPKDSNLSKKIQILVDNIKTYEHPIDITNQILDDFLLKDYTQFGLEQIVSNKEILKHLNIQFYRDDENSYLYKCNYNNKLKVINEAGNEDDGLTKIFDQFLFAREQLTLASEEQSSISTSPVTSQLMNYKTNLILYNELNANNTEFFKETFIPEFHNISSVINNNPYKIKEYITVLEKSQKFREWLKKSNEDTNLVREYYNKSTEKSWIDKLPSKGTRFLIFTGAGFISDALLTGGLGTVTGVALSAGDSFILDRLLDKWKPNYQINQGVDAIAKFSK